MKILEELKYIFLGFLHLVIIMEFCLLGALILIKFFLFIGETLLTILLSSALIILILFTCYIIGLKIRMKGFWGAFE